MKLPVVILSVMLLLGGCASNDFVRHDVYVDDELERNALTFEIVKADKFWPEDRLNVSAGNYKVSQADQGWAHSNSWDELDWAIFFDVVDNKTYSHEQRLRFNFSSESGKQWRGRCERRGSGQFTQINIGDFSQISNQRGFEVNYVCDFKADERHWQLVVELSASRGVKAYFKTPEGRYLDVEAFEHSPAHPIDNSYAGMLGFYLLDGGRNVAAVSTLPLGKVWIDTNKAPSMQDNLAMATLGLWFFHNGFDEVTLDDND